MPASRLLLDNQGKCACFLRTEAKGTLGQSYLLLLKCGQKCLKVGIYVGLFQMGHMGEWGFLDECLQTGCFLDNQGKCACFLRSEAKGTLRQSYLLPLKCGQKCPHTSINAGLFQMGHMGEWGFLD